MIYGLKLIDGQLFVGSYQPEIDLFIPQVSELQPVGHWLEADGTMKPHFSSCGGPGLMSRVIARSRGATFVSYTKERRVLPIIE